MKRSLLLLTGVICTAPLAAHASAPDADRTEAPYFVVDGPRGTTETLPLEQTRSDVHIAGTIAHVRVVQVYRNRGSEPLEATYVFPGSTRAAVFAMRMKVGDRTVEAKIQTKAAARQTYEKAKAEGRSASLLEQQRPNVFQMKVANIMPSDRIEVQLDYVEMLVPDAGVYELVIPSVVGPRYAGDQGPGTKPPSDKWVKNPYLTGQPDGSPYKWGASVEIAAGMPIAGLTSPSHRISPRFEGPATAGLKVLDEAGGDRDFVLRYRLSGDKIQSGVLLYPGADGEESFFAMMMSPPRRPAANAIPPREYIFVIDVSGSMNGFPLGVAKKLIGQLLAQLKPQDRFNVLLFAGGNRVLADESLPASAENVTQAMAAIDRQRGGGGTRLLPALKRALAMPRSDDMSTSIVVITDGYVAVEKEAFSMVRQGLGEANLFAFGIGRSVNRFLIEGLARAGMGAPFVVLDAGSAEATADEFRRYIEAPVLTDIGVRLDGFSAYDVEPSTLPDLFAERPILLFGKYRGEAKGRIVVEGRNGAGRFRQSIALSTATRDRDLVALKYLWARHRIADLADRGRLSRDGSVEKAVTALGLQYSLMTDYTSFVAVDTEVRNRSGKSKAVVQPLPVPKGVPDTAVGYSAVGAYGSGAGGGGAMALRSARVRPRALKPKMPPSNASIAPGVREPERAPSREDSAAEGRAAPAVSVASGASDVPAPLTRALKRGRRALVRCFERHAAGVRTLDARLTLSVSADGRIVKIEWLKPTGKAPFEQCVGQALLRIRVPKPKQAYRVEIPLHWQR